MAAVAQPENHHADVFYRTALQTLSRAHMNRPLPARFVAGSADCHVAEMDKFEFAFLKRADFVGTFKSHENDFVHVVSAGTVLKKKGRELLAAS
jgi:hypothetical protein